MIFYQRNLVNFNQCQGNGKIVYAHGYVIPRASGINHG